MVSQVTIAIGGMVDAQSLGPMVFQWFFVQSTIGEHRLTNGCQPLVKRCDGNDTSFQSNSDWQCMTVDDGDLQVMTVNDSNWQWLTVTDYDLWWMTVTYVYRRWLTVNYGYLQWLSVTGSDWLWLIGTNSDLWWLKVIAGPEGYRPYSCFSPSSSPPSPPSPAIKSAIKKTSVFRWFQHSNQHFIHRRKEDSTRVHREKTNTTTKTNTETNTTNTETTQRQISENTRQVLYFEKQRFQGYQIWHSQLSSPQFWSSAQ